MASNPSKAFKKCVARLPVPKSAIRIIVQNYK
jgi:hypothetical protein